MLRPLAFYLLLKLLHEYSRILSTTGVPGMDYTGGTYVPFHTLDNVT